MAWKNGVFNFEEATLQEVMHQLERWYDIEVEYETGIPKLEFVGKMGARPFAEQCVARA